MIRRISTSKSTEALLYYQSSRVPRSLVSTGRVGTTRDALGSDHEFFGADPVATPTRIEDGRGREFTLDDHGFCRVDHEWEHIDYFDNSSILRRYYAECERLVAAQTGCSRVLAFDHNLRARARKQKMEGLKGDGASAVQEPLITYGVHNDYTLRSAPRRIEALTQPLAVNDTLRARGADGTPPIDAAQLDQLLRGRWLFINMWRNVSTAPVEAFPLALCDARSMRAEDLIVFEIRYEDRVGENYFAAGRDDHRWVYFPRLTRDEAVLIKCWDSRGADFAGMVEAARGYAPLPADEPTVRATFSLHSGFEDPQTLENAPDRESIEVRCVCFFE